MKSDKRNKLRKLGFKVGTVQEFLQLSDEESELIELKTRLIDLLKARRQVKRLTQVEVARRIGSSQSRIAKMESSGVDASLDLICKALFALGTMPREMGHAFGGRKAA